MTRLRSSMLLLAISVIAVLIGSVRVLTQRPVLPFGSSYSTDANGAGALYAWADALNATVSRVGDTASLLPPGSTLLVLQPQDVFTPETRLAYSAHLAGGGTLVLAGDSPALISYLPTLGFDVDPIRAAVYTAASPDGGATLSAASRYRLRSPEPMPLLATEDGLVLAARRPLQGGSVIVILTPEPLLNGNLRDEGDARFVYRAIVEPTLRGGGSLLFDEAHRAGITIRAADRSPSFDSLLFGTTPGRAILYLVGLIFAYLVLSGRRLGPAVAPPSARSTPRTMLEHVHMLADLYRRSGNVTAARDAFVRHYARVLSGPTRPGSERLARCLRAIGDARNERDLIEAVAAASDSV